MSEHVMENLGSLIANSTLVPTANEFVPRTRSFHRRGTPPNTGASQSRPSSSYYRGQHHHSNGRKKPYNGNNDRAESSVGDNASSGGRLWRDGDREGRKNRGNAHVSSEGPSRNRQDDEPKPRQRFSSNAYAPSDDPSRNRQEDEYNQRQRFPSNTYVSSDGSTRNRQEDGYYQRQRFVCNTNAPSDGSSRNRPEQRYSSNAYADDPSGNRREDEYNQRQRFAPDTNRNRFKYNDRSRHQHQVSENVEVMTTTTPQAKKNNGGPSSRQQYRYSDRPRTNHFQNHTRHQSDISDKVDVDQNQMEALVSLLTKGKLECLVCCELVRQTHAIWNCTFCHHVLHLRCVTKWARSSKADSVWCCPACRHSFESTPSEYHCFCGKVTDPEWNRNECPHTCGSTCGLPRADPCPHKCTLSCHPGPCPPCVLYVSRSCGCGRTTHTVACMDTEAVVCGSPCGRILNCGRHKCEELCHLGDCSPCAKIIKQDCFCGKAANDAVCTKESVNVIQYCCGEICGKALACGNHSCDLICHNDDCPPCSLLPEHKKFCPCGQTALSSLPAPPRVSCKDPVPTCDALCDKILACGEPGNKHHCLSGCHEGACPECPGETSVRCRCGHLSKSMLCKELSVAEDVRCGKKCNKRRSCGKHKCRETCCIDFEHICPLPCNRNLPCGLHRCEETCHSGFCRNCERLTFEELACECGSAVTLPPVPCGARPPVCTRPCSKQHPCEHEPTHSCHSEPDCPPCTVLVAKRCHGGHELRRAVPCHLDSFSCGLPCGLPMPCGRHNCILPCHTGPCLADGQNCTQPCTVPRATCEHFCSAPCHEAPCPDIPCKEMVKVTCECGHRFSTRSCMDNAREYQRIATIQLASKMADAAAGQTVDLNLSSKKISFKTLECTEECKIIERNRRLAIGLQIRNPDLTAKLTPRYSDYLREWAKRDPSFCSMVHEKLSELVKLAKESKQKSRSYSFEPMNRDKRNFIHDYCEHFGCESLAYDPEPNRNIVATALRDKSWLPGISLMELIQRENGTRKVPLPSNAKLPPLQRSMGLLSSKSSSAWAQPSLQASTSEPSEQSSSPPQFDYFNMTPLM